MFPIISSEIISISTPVECLNRGITLMNMRPAMKMDAIGSNPVQPKCSMSIVETITPIDPRASART